MQRLAVVCVPLMALVGATTWTMYLSRRRGTMHSFRTVARSGGSTWISKACNKDRPLQTIKARFLYLQYLSSDPRKDGILIPFPYRICVQTVPQGESYNFIGTLRGDSLQQGVVASPLLWKLLRVTIVFFILLGIGSGHVREEFLFLIPFDLFTSDSESPFGRRCVNKFGVNILEGSLMGSKGKL